MSIRIALLTLLVIGLAVYAWRDWYKSLCGLILLMAVIEHPDMPKNIMGIQGLNPWNILMADILLVWVVTRRREGHVWDMPRHVTGLLLLYLAVIVVGSVRMMDDPAGLRFNPIGTMISEYFVNCMKWVIPGLLLFDGCRTQGRVRWALASIVGLYFLLAVQVVACTGPDALLTRSGMEDNRTDIQRRVGHNAVSMSVMLAGGSWAALASLPLVRPKWGRYAIAAAAGGIVLAQAMTGGRAGFLAWVGVGFVLTAVRWRKGLILVPLVPLAIGLMAPGVAERTLAGIGVVNETGNAVVDMAEATSDRALIWPIVIDKILDSPALGYGREAMVRTGLSATYAHLNFWHPHNAYLEMLLDNGIGGLLVVLLFYGVVVSRSLKLFLNRRSADCAAVGGVTAALVLSELMGAMGGLSFYPQEATVGLWAAMGLMFRVSLARLRALVSVPLVASVDPVSFTVGSVDLAGLSVPLADR